MARRRQHGTLRPLLGSIVLLLELASCQKASRDPLPHAPATSPAEGDEPHQSGELPQNPTLAIGRFDCSSGHAHKRGESLRAHESGGPFGATWNWFDAPLVCQVEVASTCQASVQVSFHAGRHFETTGVVALAPPSADSSAIASFTFEVAADRWQRELESSQQFPFETLLLLARVDGHCDDPTGVVPQPIERVDAFVGRFAGGE